MANWNDYTLKDKPGDDDTVMIKDEAAANKANKRVKFSGIWNWVVDKMATAVVARLNTTDKTVIGALNELNSNIKTSVKIGQDALLAAHDNIELKVFSCVKKNDTICFYLNANVLSEIKSGGSIFTLASGFRPKTSYIITPARAYLDPYQEIGTVWINGNTGMAQVYTPGGLQVGTGFYVYGEWKC